MNAEGRYMEQYERHYLANVAAHLVLDEGMSEYDAVVSTLEDYVVRHDLVAKLEFIMLELERSAEVDYKFNTLVDNIEGEQK